MHLSITIDLLGTSPSPAIPQSSMSTRTSTARLSSHHHPSDGAEALRLAQTVTGRPHRSHQLQSDHFGGHGSLPANVDCFLLHWPPPLIGSTEEPRAREKAAAEKPHGLVPLTIGQINDSSLVARPLTHISSFMGTTIAHCKADTQIDLCVRARSPSSRKESR